MLHWTRFLHPIVPPSMSLSPPSPHLFLSIVSTKRPIQAPMTSLKAGSGRLTGQWSHGNKGRFIRAGGMEGEREEDGENEWHSAFPLWLDAHLVAMCDRSSGANDGLPEASSIRPGLAGLPARGTKRDADRRAASLMVCLRMWVNTANTRTPFEYRGECRTQFATSCVRVIQSQIVTRYTTSM